jgi:phosphatidylglycerol lysyltransferase
MLLSGGLAGPISAADEDRPIPHETMPLSHGGEAMLRLYEPDDMPPRAIFIFGSGDGGWSPWEDVISHWLRDAGVYVVGWDYFRYATGPDREVKDGPYKPDERDFTAEKIGRDMAAMARMALRRCGKDDVPVIYGGWSSGAAQALPAAASPERPKSLAGIMLFGADRRGRYGLRASDLIGKTPEGPGTFDLSEFNKALANLRVVQFHGGADFMASNKWIQALKSPHALYEIPGANHGFDGPADWFEQILDGGVDWLLGDETKAPEKIKETLLGRRLPYGLSPWWPIAAISIGLTLFFLLSRRHSIRVLVLAVAVMGVVDLLEALFQKPGFVVGFMEQWVPLGVTEKSRLLLLISGVCQLGLAHGLLRHKRFAWILTLVMLSVTALLHLSRAFDWHHALAAAILLVPLVRWRKEFVARSDAPSLRLALGMGVVLALSLFLYGTFGLVQFSEEGNFGEQLTWGDCAGGAVSAVFLQKTKFDNDGGRDVRHFLATLRGGSLVTAFIVLALLMRPVLKRRHPEATDEDRARVREIIADHGSDPMDYFALLPDKRYFFGAGGQGVIAYALWRKFAVALADPICPAESRAVMIHAFARFCKSQDWQPMFYCSHVANRPLYEEEGFATFKVGEDARLDVNEFKLEGGKFQNLRTARNKARKNGLTFQWYDAKPQIDHGLEAQLQLLSNDWLARKHGGEMTFDLGSFSIDFIREHGAAIVRNPEGRIETFATWLPFARGTGRCLDIMRGREEARDVMDFLIVEALDHFKARGVTVISLGNAPLANVDAIEGEIESRRERAVQFLFENFDQIYGYKKLFRFKHKYQPDWQGRFLAYRPGVPLAMVGLAIAGVHLPRGFMGLLRS